MHMEHDLHLENHMVSAQSLERYYGPKAEPTARAAYRATEVEDDQEDLAALESGEMEVLAPRPALLDTSHSPSLRRSPHEIRQDQMAILRGRLAANQRELKRMNAALSFIENDPYYQAIEMKYFRGMREADIAEKLLCDPATIRRNRARLIKRLALRLYGVDSQL